MNALPCPMVPEPVKVLAVRKESPGVVTLTLDAGAKPFTFLPGQFNMLYAFGVGEVPISMSGEPSRSDVVVHTIKAVGAVSEALCRLGRGGVAGLRGPYGAPWPMSDAAGTDLVVIAGGLGLAPLRPVVYDALARRSAYRRVSLLVGARGPDDILFRKELERWQKRGDLDVLVTVDRAPRDWKGRVGVVVALLSEIEITDRTVAFVCGPEVMMRFAVRELGRRGVDDARIYLSMERNMKCAVGLCGHCQLGPSFVCKDGPVLRYDMLRPRFWLREI